MKKVTLKILLIILLIVLLVTITGCSNNNDSETKKQLDSNSEEQSVENDNNLVVSEETTNQNESDESIDAESEEVKFISAGDYTLNYGTYKFDEEDSVAGGTYVINEDGTFTFSSNWTNYAGEAYTDTGEGTYTVYYYEGYNVDDGPSEDPHWIIKFTYSNYYSTYEPSNSYNGDDDSFAILGNNCFGYTQSPGTFYYQEN